MLLFICKTAHHRLALTKVAAAFFALRNPNAQQANIHERVQHPNQSNIP
jgi:hypothetical protein